jgi:hypothetical protein
VSSSWGEDSIAERAVSFFPILYARIAMIAASKEVRAARERNSHLPVARFDSAEWKLHSRE